MEIYRENTTRYLNSLCILSMFFSEPIYQMIKNYLPFSLLIPYLWGAFLGIIDNYIDWTIK